MERALAQEKLFFETLFESLPGPAFVFGKDGRFIRWNRYFEQVLGYTPKQLADGTTVMHTIAPCDRERTAHAIEAVFRTGYYSDDLEVLTADGRRIPHHCVGALMTLEGTPYLAGAGVDITAQKEAEAELTWKTALLNAQVDSSLDGILVVDAHGRKILQNRRLVEMFSLPPEVAENPDDAQQVQFVLNRVKDARSFHEKVLHLYSHQNESSRDEIELNDGRILDRYSVPVVGRDGSHYGRLWNFRDITERKQAEAALARDEAELSAIYEHAPVMMMVLDNEYKIRRANQAALEFAGATLAEIVGRRVGDLFGCFRAVGVPRGCGFGPACANCAFQLAVQDTLKNGVAHRQTEAMVRLISGNGPTEVPILFGSTRVIIAGEPMVLLSMADISQQKRAEQRVHEQAALLDITSDAIIVVDLDGRVTFWNRGAERIYGWPVEEAVRRPMEILTSSEPQPDLAAALKLIRDTGQWNGELLQRSRSGNAITVACRGVLMSDASGTAQSILLTVSDITEAKKIEAQFLRAQRVDTLGTLASGVAHDLNNVFTPIMMSLGILEQGSKRDPEQHEMFDVLDQSVRRGAYIVRQLLTFARGSDTPRGAVRVTQVIGELRRMLGPTLPKDIELSIQAPADLWTVHGDATQLHQMLLNLCVNARDAMSDGGHLTLAAENVQVGEALARAHLGAKSGPHIRIRVTDTGMGIPTENLAKIFDPFFTTKPVGQGTGLGLATVLNIAHSHGGFVCVKSEMGGGSEFDVYLPAQESAGGANAESARLLAAHGRGELILIVDDEAPIRQTYQSVLRKFGYNTISAADGPAAEALFASRAAEIRLAVTDFMMPGKNGGEVVSALRRIKAGLPILAVSAAASHRWGIEQLPPPQVRFLAKPCTAVDLLNTVRQMLDEAVANPLAERQPHARST